MPKVTGPLFSVDAHGALAKALTYQRRPGGASVYGYKKPKVPLTVSQHNQREKIRWCVESWQSFSDAVKAEWEAKSKGQGQSGYSYFVKQTVGYVYDPDVALFLPLWMSELSGSSFLSRDSYGHLCTVHGATWGATGRTFDGLDDYIETEDNIGITGAASRTVAVWVKAATTNPGTDMLFSFGEDISYKMFQFISMGNPATWQFGDANAWYDTGVLVNATAFQFIRVTFNATGTKLNVYVDEVLTSVADLTLASMNTSVSHLFVGCKVGVTILFAGIIGEVRVDNRVLSMAEGQHIYNATKWRY